MRSLPTRIAAVLGDRRGVAALEYGVLAAGIIVAIAGTLVTINQKLSALYAAISSGL